MPNFEQVESLTGSDYLAIRSASAVAGGRHGSESTYSTPGVPLPPASGLSPTPSRTSLGQGSRRTSAAAWPVCATGW